MTPVKGDDVGWSSHAIRGAFVVGAVLVGLAYLHPALGPAAWLGTALFAAALSASGTRPLLPTLGWIVAFQTVLLFVGFPWLYRMLQLMFEGKSSPALLGMMLGFYLLTSLPPSLLIGAAFVAFRRRDGVHLWLGPAWGVGEVLRLHVTQTSLSDWLVTQWTTPPVLAALGQLGWWPTLLLCLFACGSLGRALAQRRWQAALPFPAIALAFAALPAVAPRAERLEGIAAIHTGSTLDLPLARAVDEAVTLVVWPEHALDIAPTMGEVSERGPRLVPLLDGSAADHLVGLVTALPSVGRFNQVVAMRADGRVVASRAKRILFPGGERRFLGFGEDSYTAGTAPPKLTIGAHAIIPAVCGEYLTRGLVDEGRSLGGEVLAVVARDWMFPGEVATRQLLGVQVLRSVELGVPSVRSSYGGRSSFVGADGAVLAVSSRVRNGILTWNAQRGARDVDYFGVSLEGEPAAPPPRHDIAVLYSTTAPRFRTRCPEGRCAYHALESFECGPQRAKTVIVAGHASPPTYLSHPPSEVAAAVRCFEPELVVVDACYGASSPIVEALSDLDAVFVGAPTMLPVAGFDYGPAFFEDASPWARAQAVKSAPGAPVLRWAIRSAELSATLARVAAMDGDELHERMARRAPTQIRIELGEDGYVLVPVDWARVRSGR